MMHQYQDDTRDLSTFNRLNFFKVSVGQNVWKTMKKL